jgi:signal transduction histidine kinase
MEAYRPLFRSEGIGSLAFIPLLADGQLIGKFMVYYRQRRALRSQEVELARAIADHVAAAISRFTAVARLQETVRFNEIFTGILGHDLRNPLAAMLMGSHLAMKRAQDPEMARTLNRILGSGARMTRMIDQLLDFTRLRLHKGIPVKRTRLDLVPVMQEVIDELRVLHPDRAFHQERHGDTAGEWDGDRLAQVFSNLLANAVQHGNSAGGVMISLDGTGADGVNIHVRNQGAIPDALLPKLFEPLTGRGAGRDGIQGLGLGLYITRQIVTAHGGQIAVQSDARAGTSFVVQLPRFMSPGPPPR